MMTDVPPESEIDTDYEIGQDNIEGSVGPFGFDIHNPVFGISAAAVVLFTVATLVFPGQLEPLFGGIRDGLTSNLDWFFMLAGNVFVLLCLALIVSPLGRIRLGGPEATPDFSLTGWFAMLFAAGMGIGLMFSGVSEPLGHFEAALGGPVPARAAAPGLQPAAISGSVPKRRGSDFQSRARSAIACRCRIFHVSSR